MCLRQVTAFLCSSTQRILKQKRLCCHRDKYLFGSWIPSDGGMNPFRASPRPHPILASSNLSQASPCRCHPSVTQVGIKASCLPCLFTPRSSPSCVRRAPKSLYLLCLILTDRLSGTCGPGWFSGPLTRGSGSSFLHLFNVSNDFSCMIKPMLPSIKPLRGSSLCLEITSLCSCTLLASSPYTEFTPGKL